ncbi:cytosolic phospholipase A2 gamma-like [Lampris incognitus]|uniref:cytosolic phospholipase A2 gamma-like n=1 Tax=Lampris incognitus TaxID=2546036 RepID=UPI0024B61C01|nr:cytosolic phospholipase A2 gamma-like [Lampris incognitus]
MAQIRLGHTLSDGEKDFVAIRKRLIRQCLARHKITCTLDEVPNIAIIGSGGGERAMLGLLGSLYQMGNVDLLDSAMYLGGVSGSTWCMSSIYECQNWSSCVEDVKDKVVKRISYDSVGMFARVKKLVNYYRSRDHFSLTDVWAALVVPLIVKEIDETNLSRHRADHDKDPYPVYTVIDQDSKYKKCNKECFFELTPHEAGYSINGAFVDIASFGCKYDKGVCQKKQPEMDMLYIQGLCGSALADKEEILKSLDEWLERKSVQSSHGPGHERLMMEREGLDVLRSLVKLNLDIYSGKNWKPGLRKMNSHLRGRIHLRGHMLQISEDFRGQSVNEYVERLNSDVCQSFFHWYKDLENDEHKAFVKSLEKVTEKPSQNVFTHLLPHNRAAAVETAPPAKKRDVLQVYIDRIRRELDQTGVTSDGQRVLLMTVELIQCVLNGDEGTVLVGSLNKLLEGKRNLKGEEMEINVAQWTQGTPSYREQLALMHTLHVCFSIFSWFDDLIYEIWKGIVWSIKKVVEKLLNGTWIWGTTYNFLYNIKVEKLDERIQTNPIRHFEDAGLLLNSPYLCMLRPERKIDLIISFDFSQGNPMETVEEASTRCKMMKIPFPEVHTGSNDVTAPKDFYVFKGTGRAPTVIHIPLFNVQNCGNQLAWWQQQYSTFQGAYSPDMVEKLVEKAGENVRNNKKRLLQEIKSIISRKKAAAAAGQ